MNEQQMLYCNEADRPCDLLDEEDYEELGCDGECTSCMNCVLA